MRARHFPSFFSSLDSRSLFFCRLTLPGGGECLSQAFLRRLRTDDPAYSVYTEYFQEMYDKFSTEAKEVPAAEVSSRLSGIAQKAAEADAAYVLMLQGSGNSDLAQRAKEGAEKLKLLSQASLIKGHQKTVGDLLRAVDEDSGRGVSMFKTHPLENPSIS